MKQENLHEKLESIDCRRDDKARRVSNVAPDTVADITADELENGVSLERLEALNVPVLAYSGQVTIHGKLPAFDPAARPAGYKSLFMNGNGSAGVKYCAIDAEKKKLIRRAAALGKTGWHTFANCSGFYVQRSFYVRNEQDRAAQRAATIDALKSFPVSLFYGTAGAYSLPYGLGYAVEISLGAIPQANVWQFIAEVFAVASLAEIEQHEAAEKAKRDAEHVKWEADCAARAAARAAKNAETLAGLVKVERVPENGTVTIDARGELLTVELSREKGRSFYRIAARDGSPSYDPARKLCKGGAFLWPKALAAGRVYMTPGDAAKVAAPAPVSRVSPVAAVPSAPAAAPALTDDKAAQPASKSQTWGLFCATGKDYRARVAASGLTYGQVSAALSAAQPYRGNKAGALAAVSALIGTPTV